MLTKEFRTEQRWGDYGDLIWAPPCKSNWPAATLMVSNAWLTSELNINKQVALTATYYLSVLKTKP